LVISEPPLTLTFPAAVTVPVEPVKVKLVPSKSDPPKLIPVPICVSERSMPVVIPPPPDDVTLIPAGSVFVVALLSSNNN